LARFWHRLRGSLRDQNHLAAALVTAVLRPPHFFVTRITNHIDGKGLTRQKLDHKGLNCSTIFWDGTHLDRSGLISNDAEYKTGYNGSKSHLDFSHERRSRRITCSAPISEELAGVSTGRDTEICHFVFCHFQISKYEKSKGSLVTMATTPPGEAG
jgi:hypothetical protein